MGRQNVIDTGSVRSLGTMAYENGVPERWLRNKVANGEVDSRRIGYNLFIPISETDKIKKLALRRHKKV